MKILRHGSTYKQTPVLMCDNCGLVATFKWDEVGPGGEVICPECRSKEEVIFCDKQEMKDLLDDIKDGEAGL